MLFTAYFDHLWAILNGAGNGTGKPAKEAKKRDFGILTQKRHVVHSLLLNI
jgi:hypothetical protein